MNRGIIAILGAVISIALGRAVARGEEGPGYEWVCVTPKAAFAPRDGAGALTFDGRMWLIGGWHPRDARQPFPRTCTNEVWSSRDGAEWVLEKPNTFLDATFDATKDWEGRHTAGYVVHQNKMWIVGGDPIQGHYQGDVWNSSDGRTWKHVNRGKPAPWGPRALAYTVAFRNWIWVIGGQTIPPFAPGGEKFYRDIWRSRDGVEWEQVAPEEPYWPQRGMIGGGAVFKERIWVIGGGTYDTPQTPKRKYFNDVWSSADGIHWQQHIGRAPWAARQYHDVAVFDEKLWVLEGFSSENRNDVWYSADGVQWHEVPATPWKPRHAASVFVHDGSLWMVAGNNLESDVWRLRPKTAPAKPAPSASSVPDVHQALAATRDVWGELAMHQPNGPSFDFFEKLLPPLRYVDCQFRHYPIALAAPLAVRKARIISNGSGVNVASGLKSKVWYDFPLGVTFNIGEKQELYGNDLSRLKGPVFDQGYLPIVRTEYQIGDATIAQEAFVPVDAPFGDHAAVVVRLSLVAGTSSVPLTITVNPAAAITARDQMWLDDGRGALLWLGDGLKSDVAAKRLTATLKPKEPLLLAVFSAPLESPSLGNLNEAVYQKLRTNCAAAWEEWVQRCLRLELPEERVNRAWKSTVIANLMMASGDQMSYSAGNVYQRLYEAESGDALRSLLVYGLTEPAKRMVDPLLKYVQKGLEFHDAAFRLQMLAHVYWITRDAEFVRSRRALWRPSVDHILNSREKESGLLPKENYCGDIHTQVYSLNSNANCWRGLRDIAAVLRDMAETQEAEQISVAAQEFREKISAALDKTIDRNARPLFIPIALFGSEKPYEKLTDSMMGSYWDLMIPYVLGSEILTDEQTQGALDYLHTRGGVCMGMIRFHQHSGLFANENGLDDLYGLRYNQTLLRRDAVDRALVSFYGKLAQGLTRDTFIGGEGSSLVALDPNGRPMYLPPNSAGNGLFLDLLRSLLIQDHDADEDGAPDTLRLLFATPRAWLEDGKTIRVEHALTAFGPVSIIAHSDLSHGKVLVQICSPTREAKAIKLRVRVPDGWKVKTASIAGEALNVGEDATVDLPQRRETFTVEFSVTRNP